MSRHREPEPEEDPEKWFLFFIIWALLVIILYLGSRL